jgi:hypothetical protein
MVKSKKSNFRKNCNSKGFSLNGTKAKKINTSTAYDTCSEQLSAIWRAFAAYQIF